MNISRRAAPQQYQRPPAGRWSDAELGCAKVLEDFRRIRDVLLEVEFAQDIPIEVPSAWFDSRFYSPEFYPVIPVIKNYRVIFIKLPSLFYKTLFHSR